MPVAARGLLHRLGRCLRAGIPLLSLAEIFQGGRCNLARFRTTSAFYADAIGVGRVGAGRTVADSVANSVSGDVVWTGLSAQSLPRGFTPLDAAAVNLRAASQWANTPIATACYGADSIG